MTSGEIGDVFRAVAWFADVGRGCCSGYVGAGIELGYEVICLDSGEAITVPNGANEAGVSGSGCNVMACFGTSLGSDMVYEDQRMLRR